MRKFKHTCDPAHRIVKLLGGVRATARLCKCTPPFVVTWMRPPHIRKGYGGYIPLQFWDTILKYAWVHRLPINKMLLYTGRRKREPMGRMQKRKGDEFERQVVNEIKAAGYDSHRVPLSGAVKGYHGDVRVVTPRGDWRLQLKIHGKNFGGGYTDPINMMRDVTIARIHTDWEDFICMNASVFMRWLGGEKIWALNFPVLRIRGIVIHRDMNLHHALVFRRSDGNRDWYVCFPEKHYWDKRPQHKNGKLVRFNEDGSINWHQDDPKRREENAEKVKKYTEAYRREHGLPSAERR